MNFAVEKISAHSVKKIQKKVLSWVTNCWSDMHIQNKRVLKDIRIYRIDFFFSQPLCM